ncbi:hypothetical protein C7N43_15320 [Sphingobacteriales bacterium UPWRP_1]|nr:hypothetical protein BVG80_08335 [Sphingobacteriales bacterium TSM_CSM]PSJ76147.1 hypothetical protein C7N43_15320 [Sphingobacteriales bacterium UPWRP_1]
MKKQYCSRILWIAFLAATLFVCHTALAQRQPLPPRNNPPKEDNKTQQTGGFDHNRFFGEGNIGFNAGSGFAYVSASPVLGYWFTNRISAGAGPIFEYYRWSSYKANVLGARAFGRYQAFSNLFNSGGNLFLHGQYDFLSYKDNDQFNEKRITAHRLPLGLGFSQPMGGIATFNLMALYDVLYNKNKDRNIPLYNYGYIIDGFIIQGGVNFGF